MNLFKRSSIPDSSSSVTGPKCCTSLALDVLALGAEKIGNKRFSIQKICWNSDSPFVKCVFSSETDNSQKQGKVGSDLHVMYYVL